MGLRAIHRAAPVQLGITAKCILSWLSFHADDETLVCWPSVTALAEETCMSRRAVFNALAALVESGYIEKRHSPGLGTVYQLYLPPARARGASRAPVQEVHQCTTFTGASDAGDPCTSCTEPVQEVHPEDQEDQGRSENTNARGCAREDSPAAVASIPLKDGSQYEITAEQRDHWAELFPTVNVDLSLGAMRAWCETNPGKRKTRRGVTRFITSWLTRDMNQGRNVRTPDNAGSIAGGGQPAGRRAPLPEGESSVASTARPDNSYGGSTDEEIDAFTDWLSGGSTG